MTTAPDFDPYLLPLPTPGSPVVAPHLASSLHAHLNGRYADPVWPLAPLTGNPSARKPSIYWEQWPAAFDDEMRLAAWNLIKDTSFFKVSLWCAGVVSVACWGCARSGRGW